MLINLLVSKSLALMTLKKQIEKYEFVIQTIVNNYFVAHQKVFLLQPLLEDEELFGLWNHTHGVNAVEALRMTLYTAVLSDMRAILFDGDKRTASLEHVIESLRNKQFSMAVRENYIQPPPSKVLGHDDDLEMQELIERSGREMHLKTASEQFDRLLPETIQAFDELKSSELAERVDTARSKIISHKEFKTIDGERRLYNPEDFGLKWGDAKEIVEMSEVIIFNVNLLINCSSYDLESFFSAHKLSADSFWSITKQIKNSPEKKSQN